MYVYVNMRYDQRQFAGREQKKAHVCHEKMWKLKFNVCLWENVLTDWLMFMTQKNKIQQNGLLKV
jgi:hypothetical protein